MSDCQFHNTSINSQSMSPLAWFDFWSDIQRGIGVKKFTCCIWEKIQHRIQLIALNWTFDPLISTSHSLFWSFRSSKWIFDSLFWSFRSSKWSFDSLFWSFRSSKWSFNSLFWSFRSSNLTSTLLFSPSFRTWKRKTCFNNLSSI